MMKFYKIVSQNFDMKSYYLAEGTWSKLFCVSVTIYFNFMTDSQLLYRVKMWQARQARLRTQNCGKSKFQFISPTWCSSKFRCNFA